MEIIVTGFDPFAEYSRNPSADTVGRLLDYVHLDDETSNNESQLKLKVAKKILPTCCSEAWQELETLVTERENSPFLLLITGFADKRDKIELERFALNTRQYKIPDNNKHLHSDEYLEPSAPEAYRSKLPLNELVEGLTQAGYLCKISNHAGTFICNEVYFRSMHKWQNHPNCAGILFVHLPPPENYCRTLAENKLPERDALDCYADCLTIIGELVYKNLK